MALGLQARVLLFAATAVSATVSREEQVPPGETQCLVGADGSCASPALGNSMLSTQAQITMAKMAALNEETDDSLKDPGVLEDHALPRKSEGGSGRPSTGGALQQDTPFDSIGEGESEADGDASVGETNPPLTGMPFVLARLAQLERTVTSLTEHNIHLHEKVALLQETVSVCTDLLQDNKVLNTATANMSKQNHTLNSSLLLEIRANGAAAIELSSLKDPLGELVWGCGCYGGCQIGCATVEEENAAGVGGWGGLCTCPDGRVYQVGDNNDQCNTLACVNGSPGQCQKAIGAWSKRRVTCGMSSGQAAAANELLRAKALVTIMSMSLRTNSNVDPGNAIKDFVLHEIKKVTNVAQGLVDKVETELLKAIKPIKEFWDKMKECFSGGECDLFPFNLLSKVADVIKSIIEGFSKFAQTFVKKLLKDKAGLIQQAAFAELPKSAQSQKQLHHADKNFAIHVLQRPLVRAPDAVSSLQEAAERLPREREEDPEMELAEVASVSRTEGPYFGQKEESSHEGLLTVRFPDGSMGVEKLITQFNEKEYDTSSCLAFAPKTRTGGLNIDGRDKIKISDWQVVKNSKDHFIQLEPWAVPCTNVWMKDNAGQWEGYSFYRSRSAIEKCVVITFSFTANPVFAFVVGYTIDFLPAPLFSVAISVCWPNDEQGRLSAISVDCAVGAIPILKYSVRLTKRFGSFHLGEFSGNNLDHSIRAGIGDFEYTKSTGGTKREKLAFDEEENAASLIVTRDELLYNMVRYSGENGFETVLRLEGDDAARHMHDALFPPNHDAVSLGEKGSYNRTKLTIELFHFGSEEMLSPDANAVINFGLAGKIEQGVIKLEAYFGLGGSSKSATINLIDLAGAIDTVLGALPFVGAGDKTEVKDFMTSGLDKVDLKKKLDKVDFKKKAATLDSYGGGWTYANEQSEQLLEVVSARASCMTVHARKKSWEIGWSIAGCTDGIKYGSELVVGPKANSHTHDTKCCPPPGTHTLHCLNSEVTGGDGWHGGYITIQGNKYCEHFRRGRSKTVSVTITGPPTPPPQAGTSATDINDLTAIKRGSYTLPSYTVPTFNEVLVQRVSANWCDSWGRNTGNIVKADGASMGVQADAQFYYYYNNRGGHKWVRQPATYLPPGTCSGCWVHPGNGIDYDTHGVSIEDLEDDGSVVKISFPEHKSMLKVGNLDSFLEQAGGCDANGDVKYRVYTRLQEALF